jgi:beta-galactosidase
MVILRNMLRLYLGPDILLFTTDGDVDVEMVCGNVPEVYGTVDFGTTGNVTEAYAVQKRHQPQGPFVCSEYYSGWMDHWGEQEHIVDPDLYAQMLDEILQLNGSVSMYMYHGGTNFGFISGSTNEGIEWSPIMTTYDYDAPLNESGDPTDKFFTVKNTIAKYMSVPDEDPAVTEKMSFGPVELISIGSFWDLMSVLVVGEPVLSEVALTFEELSQAFGYVLYETTVQEDFSDGALLVAANLSDRAYVYVDYDLQAVLERSGGLTNGTITATVGQILRVLVENQGRLDWGDVDIKGLRGEVTLGDTTLEGPWIHYSIPLNNTAILLEQGYPSINSCDVPGVFTGNFTLPEGIEVLDTFLDTTGWGKGFAFLNGINLGRYWPLYGSQMTLYVPGVYLNSGPSPNTLLLVEFEQGNCQDSNGTISFVSMPVL